MKILYLCKEYVIVEKDYGMLSERPANGAERANVPDAIAEALKERGIGFDGIYTVHRLDATTAGVMVYALTKSAAAALSKEIAEGRFAKTYLAWITADASLPKEGKMCDYLYFDRRADKSFVVKEGKRDAKEARLSYVLGEPFELDGEPVTPATVKLETGRTHQIRVQFAARKSPLVGDGKYGSRIKRRDSSLWSVELRFFWKGEEKVYKLENDVNVKP